MTANHEHTPSTEHVRFIYSLDGADREYKAQGFDRWYQAEIAAAEQRGAERERKDIAASLIDWDVMYGHEPGDEETRIQHDIANWIHSRADRLEGDDETH